MWGVDSGEVRTTDKHPKTHPITKLNQETPSPPPQLNNTPIEKHGCFFSASTQAYPATTTIINTHTQPSLINSTGTRSG